MANYKKEYWNKTKTKQAIITRSKYADGYNYYITIVKKGNFSSFVIDSSYKQKEITSEQKAIEEAKRAIK